jgi:hypothetical protein
MNLGIEAATKFGKRENKAGSCIVKMVVSGDRWVPVCSVVWCPEIGWQRLGSRYTMLSLAPYVWLSLRCRQCIVVALLRQASIPLHRSR